jgi:acyl dehydratase
MSSLSALQDGQTPEPWSFGPLTRTDFVRYQGASGDMNPVHHDEGFAKEAGYKAPLAVGMFAAGAMNSYATAWLGAANVRRTRMRWKAPAFPGYTLTVSANIARVYEENSENKVDIELTVTDQTGAVSVQGWMTFVVPAGAAHD